MGVGRLPWQCNFSCSFCPPKAVCFRSTIYHIPSHSTCEQGIPQPSRQVKVRVQLLYGSNPVHSCALLQFHGRKDESSSDEDDVRGRGTRDRAPPSKRMKNDGDEEDEGEWVE